MLKPEASMQLLSRFLPVLLVFCFSPGWLAAEGGPTPDQALETLKAGHARFLAGNLLHPNQDAARRQATAQGQTPYAAILGCADSRESLDIVFDAGIGDLFTIRVAGNVADTDEIASLEYGAEHLHTPLILVLGHTSCGAVTAVVKKAELTGQLPGLLDNIAAPAARAFAAYGAAPDLVDRTARENVLQSIQDLLSRSKVLSELVEAEKLRVVGGLYHLDTGAIEWMERLPSEASWVATGLSGGEAPPEATVAGTVWLVDAGVFLGALVLLALVQILFVSERRWLASVKFRGRLAASFLAVTTALSAGAVVALVQADALPLVSALAAVLIYSLVFTRSHHAGFHRFFLDQKTKWERAQAPSPKA